MMTTSPAQPQTSGAEKGKRYSKGIRLWHWLNALVITGSLLTVLLNSTITNTRSAAGVIQGELKDKGVTLTSQQARTAGHALSDQVWSVHTYFGYGLIALLLFRLFVEFTGAADKRLLRKIKNAWRRYQTIKENREASRHEFWVKTLYAVFYVVLMISAITGLCLAFEDDVPALHRMHFIREIHQFNMYIILAFIAVHLAGVFLAEHKEDAGIVSDMINGGSE